MTAKLHVDESLEAQPSASEMRQEFGRAPFDAAKAQIEFVRAASTNEAFKF